MQQQTCECTCKYNHSGRVHRREHGPRAQLWGGNLCSPSGHGALLRSSPAQDDDMDERSWSLVVRSFPVYTVEQGQEP